MLLFMQLVKTEEFNNCPIYINRDNRVHENSRLIESKLKNGIHGDIERHLSNIDKMSFENFLC